MRDRSHVPVRQLPAAVRLIHPAPAFAVIAVSAALALILAAQAGIPFDARLPLIVVSVAASQVATGALNDWADRHRDRRVRPEKPIPAGETTPAVALALGLGGLAVQFLTSALLGPLTLLLAAAVSISAQGYNFVFSRTPLSVLPYLISFGLLPAWIASGIGVPVDRVVTASLLVMPFAAAAHLVNALQDHETDARERSRNLSQVLGRRASRLVAASLALGVGIAVAAAFALSGRLHFVGVMLGLLGIVSVAQGIGDERRLWYGMLVAALLWTVGWAISTG